MLPAVRYDYYKTGLNRDVRSVAPIPRRQPSELRDKRRSVGRGPSSNPCPSSGESRANLVLPAIAVPRSVWGAQALRKPALLSPLADRPVFLPKAEPN